VSKTFRTTTPNQPKVVIRVVEGESAQPEECAQVGVCTIENLPADLPQGTPVHVTYAYRENGQLEVTAALEEHPGVSTTFARANRLAAGALDQWAAYVETAWGRRNA
jgi:molecular chaperone DnaK